ncbi:hypothetical protein GZH47_12590 [Paenibacillus rhizovicinus]|uniref:Tyrosinase copper-binding domain-containing protein n=1 Tax=Paenibacillus rhizovicinus TaxID=2704463 RepID=A0A6C0P056_9BACL|nr:hypothetical protein [Paenibacillus rhizovicinus]QHW31596.1 hypothetical protein GZH47_12590 [Paenibacillus rhizovicinus]
MPIIPNFPQSLLQEHMRWHHANHYNDPSQLPPGYGLNFLQFHRQFINKVYQWYNGQGLDPQLVAGWQGVPEAIRNTPCYNQQAEARVLYNPQSFASADQLGLFLEQSNLHGCIHQEAARIFGEPYLNDFDIAPQSTMFYNIHGMIDQWYRNWERATGNARAAGNKPAAGSARGRSGRSAGSAERLTAKTKRGNVSGAAQAPKGPLRSGPQSTPAQPFIKGAARPGIHLYSKKPGAGRNRKP